MRARYSSRPIGTTRGHGTKARRSLLREGGEGPWRRPKRRDPPRRARYPISCGSDERRPLSCTAKKTLSAQCAAARRRACQSITRKCLTLTPQFVSEKRPGWTSIARHGARRPGSGGERSRENASSGNPAASPACRAIIAAILVHASRCRPGRDRLEAQAVVVLAPPSPRTVLPQNGMRSVSPSRSAHFMTAAGGPIAVGGIVGPDPLEGPAQSCGALQ